VGAARREQEKSKGGEHPAERREWVLDHTEGGTLFLIKGMEKEVGGESPAQKKPE